MDAKEINQGLAFINALKKIVDNDDSKVKQNILIEMVAKKHKVKDEWFSWRILSEYFGIDINRQCGLVGKYRTGIEFRTSHIKISVDAIDKIREEIKNLTENASVVKKQNIAILNELINQQKEEQKIQIKRRKEAARIAPLSLFSPNDLIRELRLRGFKGDIEKAERYKL